MLVSFLQPPLNPCLPPLLVVRPLLKSVLQFNFFQKSIANSSLYCKHFVRLSRGTRTISEYVQEAKAIADALAAIEEPLSNQDSVNAVLGGLGFEFDMLVIAIESSALCALLLNFESRHQISTQPTPAAYLSSQMLAPMVHNTNHWNTNQNS